MRDYGKVSPTFWTGKTGREIKEAGKDSIIIALYLMTNRHSNMNGLYYLPLEYLCKETGISQQGATKALAGLSEAEFAFYDDDDEIVYVPEMAKWQIQETLEPKDKRVKGVMRELHQYKNSIFAGRFYDRYKECFNLPEVFLGVDFTKALNRAYQAPSKGLRSPSEGVESEKYPLRSQEQEQEQEQEQDQEQGAPQNGAHANGVSPLTPLALLWNEILGDILLPVEEVSKTQRKKEALRLKERPLEGWRKLFEMARSSDFLTGKCSPRREGEKPFFMDFDWIIDNDTNHVKVYSGKYNNRVTTQQVKLIE